MMRTTILFCIALVIICLRCNVNAYEFETHAALTGVATKKSVLRDVVKLNGLGIAKSYDDTLQDLG